MCSLTGEVALVTGASRGLGKAIARGLADEGARVAVNYYASHESAEQLVNEITATGGEAITIQADITDQAECNAMVDAIEAVWGPVTVLVNNATGPQPLKPIEEYTWQDYLDQLHFFVKAPLELTQRVLPAMKAAGRGRIINIGSEVMDLGNPNYSAYVTAKAAMLGMTRSWANELGPFGIQVNLVAPGFIPVERHIGMPKEAFAAYTAGVALGHQGVPEDIAAAVVFLAGPGGRFITGQTLSVNGGKTF